MSKITRSNKTSVKTYNINKTFWTIVVIIIFIIFVICVWYYWSTREPSVNCVCVFDLDDTITCGLDNAKTAINECRSNSCKFAINTARTSTFINDINFSALGLDPEEIKDDHYTGDWNTKKVSYTSKQDLMQQIANKKTEHMYHLSNKYNVPKNRIILFDDNYTNINIAKDHGFSTIYANSKTCGLGNNVGHEINSILDQ
jgi:hypothetical protein